MSTATQRQKLSALIRRRERTFAKIQCVHDLTTKEDKIQEFLARCQRLTSIYEEFESIQTDIINLCAAMDPEDSADTIASTKVFEELYFKVLAHEKRISSHPATEAPRPKLPKISLPVFGGDIRHWTSFHSLFKSLIHENTSLNNIEKLQYLFSSVQGTAANLIGSLALEPQNYAIAYKALLDRYENKRLLGSGCLDKLTSFRPLSYASLSGLQSFVDTFRVNVAALKALEFVDLGQVILLHLGLRVLDQETRKSFETEYSAVDDPSFDNLIDFVQDQCKILELSSSSPLRSKADQGRIDLKTGSGRKNSLLAAKIEPDPPQKTHEAFKCPLCKGDHKLHSCTRLIAMEVPQRHSTVKRLERCYNCLGKHLIAACGSKSKCRVCHQSSHHTLLHVVSNAQSSLSPSKENTQASSSSETLFSCNLRSFSSDKSAIILGTACAFIKNSFGRLERLRIVIDPASQVSCMTASCAQRLGLSFRKSRNQLMGVGDVTVPVSKGVVNCAIIPCDGGAPSIDIEAVLLPSITGKLPSAHISPETQRKFSHLSLADKHFHTPQSVDLLLGADHYANILKAEPPLLMPNQPAAISTVFGWVIVGRAAVSNEFPVPTSTSLLVARQDFPLDHLLKRFWEIEEVASPPILNPDDKLCEDHFMRTHYRDVSGRYVVSLPFRSNPSLGSNRNIALKRFKNLEHRLASDNTLRQDYDNFMSEYLQLEHMQICSSPSSYVIPHHCIVRETNSGMKLRVVFDASAKGSSQRSLNDELLTGPKLQRDISEIITNFRRFPVALCADIRQMYRQILVAPGDRKYQHIYCRPPNSTTLNEFELNTVTYGVSSSAYLAQRVLKQLVADEGYRFPMAADAILFHTYVDDIVTGADSEIKALELQKQLIQLLQCAGFELRKWSSSSSVLLDNIPAEHRELTKTLSESEDCSLKVLGLTWDPQSDCFTYRSIQKSVPVTKRAVLSSIARIFDPLGWLTPVVMFAKCLLQRLWQCKQDWDDPLPHHLSQDWHNFQVQLRELSSVRIPRPFALHNSRVSLVGFADASLVGYAAVIYLRTETEDSNVTSQLVIGKSKVAPQAKPLTIPRLELCAALLLARLFSSLKVFIERVNVDRTFFFTDSTIVLAWLNTPPHSLKTFVANRVTEIVTLSQIENWKYVPSQENAADCASRGLVPKQLLSATIWWHGPRFLSLPESQWPSPPLPLPSELPELKTQPHPSLITAIHSPENISSIIFRFSSLSRLTRVTAFILRFIHNTKNPLSKRTGVLSSTELSAALLHCIRHEQSVYFSDLIRVLTQGHFTSSLPHSVAKLSPFLDKDQLLRVGGRLRHSDLHFNQKFPILLPKKSHLSSLICDYYHRLTCHAGPRMLQALIQRRYWIVSLRSLIRQRIFNCTICCRYNAMTKSPKMADLPSHRFHQERAFVNVGVDYGGPFMVKENLRRNSRSTKGYLCLFICLSTKAVHLELASDLSTPAFLAALDRFIARRGLCSNIYSDNGTNFLGAARHLQEVYQFLKSKQNKFKEYLSNKEVQWHFNPPHSPHFGGIWEAGIKAAKRHLYRIIGNRALTFEEFSTLFCRIESILNSRPLCHISNDPHDGPDYLSPGHFLIGGPLLAPTEVCLSQTPLNHLSRWQLLQHELQSFWKSWSNSYLQTLIPRSKWDQDDANIKVGDMVFIRNVPTSPMNWPLGRIEEVLPGRDGVVRVARVRTASGSLVRPVRKLVLLPAP